jgi:DNA-binding SARP family transcriptional activator
MSREGAQPVRISVLGSMRISRGGRDVEAGPPRQQAVLAMLALRANQAVSRDELVDGVWGADPPASVVNSVHTYVSSLRRVLEPGRGPRKPGRVLVSVFGLLPIIGAVVFRMRRRRP